MAMFKSEPPIIEFTTKDKFQESIKYCHNKYLLYSFEDKWIFPFIYRKISLNIDNLSLPDDVFAWYQSNFPAMFDIKVVGNSCVKVRYKGGFPHKVLKETPLVRVFIIKNVECLLVEHEQETDG